MDSFPVLLQPAANESPDLLVDDFISQIKQEQAWIKQQLERSGAVLLRGFPVRNGADFSRFVQALDGYEALHNHSGSQVRRHIEGGVYTANEDLPLEVAIGFHNEITYMPVIPDVLALYCEVAPPEGGGGATGIARGDQVYKDMFEVFPEFLEDLEAKGACYYWILPESELPANHSEYHKLRLEDGRMKLYRGPCAAITQLQSGKKAWFNCIGASYMPKSSDPCVEFGDGTHMPRDALDTACEIMDKRESRVQWQQGDVLLLDNWSVLHARHPSKSPRHILVSMLKLTGNKL